MIYENRRKPKGLLFHRDQGYHYTSKAYRQCLWRFGMRRSLSRHGNCWDNSPVERFFRSFKTEWIPRSGYFLFSEVLRRLLSTSMMYHNLHYPHSNNGELSPIMAEEKFGQTSKEATGFS